MKLDTKLLLFFAIVSLGFARLLGVSARRGVHAALLSNLERSAEARLPEVLDSMRVGLAPGNSPILDTFLADSLPGLGASYALALYPDGDVASSAGIDAAETAVRREVFWGETRSRELELGGKPFFEVVLPVFEPAKGPSGRYGALVLGYSLAESRKTEAAIDREIFWFLGASGGLAMLILLILTRGMLAPIRELAGGVERIIEGRYGTTVPVRTRDEIGDLAQRFNQMSLELAETTVSKDYFTGVLQNMPDGVFVAGPDGVIKTANAALRRLVGCSDKELVGRAAWTLFSGGNPFSGPAFERLSRGTAMRNIETRLLTREGGEVPVLLSGALLRDPHGRADGIIGVAKDIGELKRKDEELRRREAQLFESEKLSAVGRLAAGIAHEINDPLGSILGFAQTALRKAREADRLSYSLRCIEDEALRCRRLVQNLLMFSRRGQDKREVFDLNDAVERSLVMVQAQARVRGISVVKELGEETSLRGDRNQIEQVVMNLCCNAIDAMPAGGRLTLRTRRPLQGGEGAVWLEVQDSGAGVPEDLRARIFEPFFTTKAVGEGTGLGLSLAHEIVARHGGVIEVKNAPGKGALFRVCLPRGAGR